VDPYFSDDNKDWIQKVTLRYPQCETLEMETFEIFHLAQCASYYARQTGNGSGIRAASCAMVFANRKTNAFITAETVEYLERRGAIATLEAVTSTEY
jgi:uridine phosphorylase